jgi:hypothetical protein
MDTNNRRFELSQPARLTSMLAEKHHRHVLNAAIELLDVQRDSNPGTTELVRALLQRFVFGRELAISRAPGRSVNSRTGDLFYVRSLPLDEPGLRLEVQSELAQGRDAFSPGRVHFRLVWIEFEGARPPRENERTVAGLLAEDGPGIPQSEGGSFSALPSWRHDVPAQWDRWNELLECLEELARLKTLQLPASVLSVDDGGGSVRIALAASPAMHERELLSSGDLELIWGLGMNARVSLGTHNDADDTELSLDVSRGSKVPPFPAGTEVRLATRPDLTVLQRQRAALGQLRDAKIQNPHLATALINPAEARELPPEVWPAIPIVDVEKLRPAQRSAVEAALSAREVTFIWGPPGTGKTEVIRAISQSAVAAGLRVLVVSQANAAVDNAVSRVKQLKGMRPLRLAQKDIQRTDENVKDVLDKVAVGSFLRRLETLADVPGELAHAKSAVQAFLHAAPKDGEEHEKRAINELWEPYRRSVNLIGCTCAQAARLDERCGVSAVDLVIIDEVSKATLVEMLPALVRGTKVVLVGDHCQLPPVFRDDEQSLRQTLEQAAGSLDPDRLAAARELVDEPYFKNCKEQAEGVDGALATLNEQHRMHPFIREMVSRFYEYGLEDAPHVTVRSRALPFGPQILRKDVAADTGTLWIDTGGSHKEDRCGTSRQNPGEARVLVDLVRDLARQVAGVTKLPYLKLRLGERHAGKLASELLKPVEGTKLPDGLQWTYWLDGHPVRPDTRCESDSLLVLGPALPVACITFYKAQKELLRRKLDELAAAGGLIGLNCRVDTVDSYQGSEAEFVVLSLVRTGFRSDSPFVTDFRRVNVAMSRARRFLCIVGCRASFSKALVQLPSHSAPVPVYGSILETLQKRNSILRCA